MGVLACDRNGCENIMCDHHSPEYGYLCHECFSELRDKAGQVTIQAFMDSPKGQEDRERLADEELINNTFQST